VVDRQNANKPAVLGFSLFFRTGMTPISGEGRHWIPDQTLPLLNEMEGLISFFLMRSSSQRAQSIFRGQLRGKSGTSPAMLG
jgi:hypothetical protein